MAQTAALRDISKLLAGNVLAKLFGVASLIVFARVLPKTQMAVFPAYLTLIGMPSLFLSLGIFQSIIRRLPSLILEAEAEARSLVVTASILILTGTIVVCVVAIPFSERIAVFFFDSPRGDWIVRLSLIGSVAATVSKLTEFMYWGLGRFGRTSIIQVLEATIRPSLTVSLYFLFGLKGLVTGLVVAQFVLAAVSLWFVRDILAGPIPRAYPIARLLRESFPFYIDNYLWYLKGDGDTLVAALLGPSLLAEYYIAKSLYSYVMVGWVSIDRVALQRLAQSPQISDALRYRVRAMHTRICEIAIPAMLLLIATAPQSLMVLVSSRYVDAIGPAMGLLAVLLLQFVSITVNRTVFVCLPGAYRLSTSAVEAVGVLISAATLVPYAGIAGMALARLAGPAAGCIYAALLLQRKLGLYLPWAPALRTATTALPATLISLLVVPHGHSTAAELGWCAAAGGLWLLLFAILTYVFNRTLFEKAKAFVSNRT